VHIGGANFLPARVAAWCALRWRTSLPRKQCKRRHRPTNSVGEGTCLQLDGDAGGRRHRQSDRDGGCSARPGVEVLTADSGKQALELLEQQAIDLVLMDCHMPEMDGLAATRHWRDKEALLRRRRLPVIGLTGDVYSGAREACLEAGADDCRPQRPAPRLGRYSPAGRPGLEPPDPVARRMKGVNSRPWDRLIVTSRHVTRLPVGNGRQAKPVRHR